MNSFSILTLAALVPISAMTAPQAKAAGAKECLVYVGTYTGAKSKGIYRYHLNLETGALDQQKLVAETPSPSFLALHPGHRFLYAANEVDSLNGKPGGAVSAFAIDPKTGDLQALNQQSSQGAGPCHLTVDRTGRNVIVANYGAGSIAVLPTQVNGSLKPASAFVQHKGSSVNAQRQEAPHAHSVNLDPGNRYLFAADLGLDKVLIYKFDPAQGTLTANVPEGVSLKPGAGPRHFTFHPSGRFAYVINELHSSVTAFSYKSPSGELTEIQTIPTLSQPVEGNSTAEVQIHPSGKFLYGSNRGHNSIAMFRVDPDKGTLTAIGHQSTGGKTPRNFGIDPTGRFLLAANQDSNSISVFRIDPANGTLSAVGAPVETPMPVCIKFLPRN